MSTFAAFVQTTTEHNLNWVPGTDPLGFQATTQPIFQIFVKITADVLSGLRGLSTTTNLTYRLSSTLEATQQLSMSVLTTNPYPDALFPTSRDTLFNATTGLAQFALQAGNNGEFSFGGYGTNANIESSTFTIKLFKTSDLVNPVATSNQFVINNGTDTFPACFQKGTHLLTPEGEKPVELLRKGDLVISAKTGKSVPIKSMLGFLGTQTNCPLYCLPKDALGENKPKQDLFLSHRHRVSLDGQLRHMVCLADMGKSVPTGKDEIEYYHIELADCFDTVIAEGLEVETFIDPRVVGHDWECTSACCTYIPIGPQPKSNESLFESLAITA
jgi:hypothetical protein